MLTVLNWFIVSGGIAFLQEFGPTGASENAIYSLTVMSVLPVGGALSIIFVFLGMPLLAIFLILAFYSRVGLIPRSSAAVRKINL